jgi:hypothetical protein
MLPKLDPNIVCRPRQIDDRSMYERFFQGIARDIEHLLSETRFGRSLVWSNDERGSYFSNHQYLSYLLGSRLKTEPDQYHDV